MKKTSTFEVRISAAELELVSQAALLKDMSLSDYAISRVVEAARRDIEDGRNLMLSKNDADIFFELIENPPEPKDALKALMNSDRDR